MEPLDDVALERVGHDHEQQHGLVPDDATQEPLQVGCPGPLHVEEADERGHEDQEIGHTEVGAGAAHALDEDGAWQDDDGHEDRIDHEEAEGEDQTGDDDAGQGVRRGRHPGHRGKSEHGQPRRGRSGQSLPRPRQLPGTRALHSGAGAHRDVGGTVMGLGACRSGLRGRPMNGSGRTTAVRGSASGGTYPHRHRTAASQGLSCF